MDPTAAAARAVRRSAACELTTAAGGRPMVYPVTPFFDGDRERIVISSPPAYSGKVDAIRANPHVALRCYQAEPPVVIHGEATVREEDPWAAATALEQLVANGPDTPKRRAMETVRATLEDGLAKHLMDWYRLRLLVEIEPVSVEHVPAVAMPAVPAWDAAGIGASEARSYERVVLGTVDDDRPVPHAVEELTLSGDRALVGAPTDPTPGPACLLCHWHSWNLERLGQRAIRGRLTDDGTFDPGSAFQLRNQTPLDALRFVLEGKRRTRAYFGETSPLKWTWDA